MKLKQSIIDVLVAEGMTPEEMQELFGRMIANKVLLENIVQQTQNQLEHNAVVKVGLDSTLNDAQSKLAAIDLLINKVSIVEEVPNGEVNPL